MRQTLKSNKSKSYLNFLFVFDILSSCLLLFIANTSVVAWAKAKQSSFDLPVPTEHSGNLQSGCQHLYLLLFCLPLNKQNTHRWRCSHLSSSWLACTGGQISWIFCPRIECNSFLLKSTIFMFYLVCLPLPSYTK